MDLPLHAFDLMVKATSELFLLSCNRLPELDKRELQILLRPLHSSLLALQLLLCSLILPRGKRLGRPPGKLRPELPHDRLQLRDKGQELLILRGLWLGSIGW